MAAIPATNPYDFSVYPVVPMESMLVKDLRSVHKLYALMINDWRFKLAAYEGVRALVAFGAVEKHERESIGNYNRRLRSLYGFSYSRTIVELFNFYLFKKDVRRSIPEIVTQTPEWAAFLENCNLFGDSLAEYIADQARYAKVYGHVAFLVDKPILQEGETFAAGDVVHPYLVAYHPPAILDWYYERDKANRPILAYLKVRDDDGTFRLWWRNRIQVWGMPREAPAAGSAGPATTSPNPTGATGSPYGLEGMPAEKLFDGENKLGEIPLVWLVNVKGRIFPTGVSDIEDISRIDLSLINNLSQGEEIINYAAFPMLRKPKEEAGRETQDEVGVTAVLEFDPERPESKPDWLPAEVSGPIDAILRWIERKVQEVYRSSNTGGVAATETTPQPKSGVALTVEFQQLNAKVVQAAINVEKAERAIIKFWLKWQKQDQYGKEVRVERSRDYDVQNLAQDLANAMTANTLVQSETFKRSIQKALVRVMLPGAEDKVLEQIDAEIDEKRDEALANEDKQKELPDFGEEDGDGDTEGDGKGEDESGDTKNGEGSDGVSGEEA
jgi:hypothetical protein